MLAPVLDRRGRHRVGSRFAGDGGYRSSATRRIGIRLLACDRLARSRASASPTRRSGFQALNRKAIELFAADYPHDYPEVEGMVMAIRHRLRLREVPVRDARARSTATRRSRALRSIYYMAKVLLALFVGLFRRASCRWRTHDRRGDPLKVSIAATVASLLLARSSSSS